MMLQTQRRENKQFECDKQSTKEHESVYYISLNFQCRRDSVLKLHGSIGFGWKSGYFETAYLGISKNTFKTF